MKKNDEIKYRKAKEELEEILDRLDKEEIDIDELAKEIKRATELIRICKQKIENAEMEVKRVLESFEKDEEEENN